MIHAKSNDVRCQHAISILFLEKKNKWLITKKWDNSFLDKKNICRLALWEMNIIFALLLQYSPISRSAIAIYFRLIASYLRNVQI